MTKQQQHIINTMIQPWITIGNIEQAKRMVDTLIRSARTNKAQQALEAFKSTLG
jgi:polyhydroxyalkanoate synthesis regulator phasin